MVHRAADSRLLSNLLQQEKDYSKQLNQVLDSSNASLASFAAYAAASPPPASQVIMAVTTSLAAADEALRRYVRGVEEWRESMRILKDAEEEVGNIMRDREILVTRMIKASKSHKSGSSNFRDSLLLGHQRFPSSSSLALSFTANQDSPSPPPSRPLSGAFSSTKLAAAQSELQACEAHLAAKERELDVKRCAAVREGMGARVKAMMDCGWAWNQHGKEALRALEDLKVEALEYKPAYIPDTHPDDVFQSLKIPDPDSTRLSSDFSSIGPSQSASQVNVDHEHLPPPVHMGSIMNSGLFGDPPRRFDNNDDSALPVQQDQSTLRPPSGQSTTTSTLSAIPATYKVETMTYAQAVAVHVAGRDASSSSSPAAPAPPPIPASSSQLLSSSDVFMDEDVHKSVRIPAPHALEGYAFEIPTAEVLPVAGPSGVKHHHRSRSNTPPVSGRSTPQPVATGPGPSPLSAQPLPSQTQTQVPSSYYYPPKRHVLEKRITEEELRQSVDDVDERRRSVSSTEEDVKTEKKLLVEGKLAVVENPRFMTEARKKELEKEEERERRARAKAEAKAKAQARVEHDGDETETETPKKEKEKKRFSFFHSPSHSLSQNPRLPSSTTSASGSAPAEQHVTFDAQAAEPSTTTTTKSPGPSPSKGFFGSLKGFFVSKHSGPSSSQSQSPSPSKSRNRRPIATLDSSDDDEDASPTTRSASASASGGGGLQSLFRGASYSSSSKDKDKQRSSSTSTNKWETRTDKNIRQLSKRASLDEGSLGLSSRRPGVGLGAGLAGRAVMNVGYVSASEVGVGGGSRVGGVGGGVETRERGRAVSDVGVGSSKANMNMNMNTSPGGGGGRRLKKNRGGPPVSQSALGRAGRKVVSSTESLPIDAGTQAQIQAQGRLPARSASAASAQEKGKTTAVATGTGTGTGKKATSRRSASVDVGGARRRTWTDDDGEEEEGGSSSGGGMIVDLGKRRKASSDLGHGGGRVLGMGLGSGSGKGVVGVPSPATATATATQQQQQQQDGNKLAKKEKGKGYSSDTAAMVVSAPAPAAVARKKSLTKKKTDTATTTLPPMPASTSVSSAAAAASPARKASVKSTASATITTTTKSGGAKAKGAFSSSSALGVVGAGSSTTTFLAANNDNPSGTLVAQPGWNAHALGYYGAGPGLGLKRNLSVTSSASAPPPRGVKQTSLGQGVVGGGAGAGVGSNLGLGRRASLGTSSTKATVGVGVGVAGGGGSGSGSVVQPAAPPAASLMSIVEDVARSNREGWISTTTPESKKNVRKSVGGSQRAVGMMEVVRAPPAVGREALQAMVGDPGKSRTLGMGGGGGGGASMTMTGTPSAMITTTTTATPQKTAVRSPMFEIKAPGSVFDQKSQTRADKAMEAQAQAQAQPAALNSALESSRPPAQAGQSKAPPLRSAMRNPSPGPSRPTPAGKQQLPHPVNGPLLQEGAKRTQDKGKGRAVDLDDGGTSTDSETYETGNEFYSGEEEEDEEEEEENVRPVSLPAKKNSTTTTNPILNGHHEYTTPKKASSDASHSTTSTLLVGPSGSSQSHKNSAVATSTPTPASRLAEVQRHPSLVTHDQHGSGSQTPRRRKSVRVSLQPTFSPPPPAMDYDYEEEQGRYAPWNGMEVPRATRAVGVAQPRLRQDEVPVSARQSNMSPAPAPIRVPGVVTTGSKPGAKFGGVGNGNADADANDMWQDSGSDEDEEYARAKRLLTRAAKREKDISILVANRA